MYVYYINIYIYSVCVCACAIIYRLNNVISKVFSQSETIFFHFLHYAMSNPNQLVSYGLVATEILAMWTKNRNYAKVMERMPSFAPRTKLLPTEHILHGFFQCRGLCWKTKKKHLGKPIDSAGM